MKYQTILIDPPWPSAPESAYSRSSSKWPYPTIKPHGFGNWWSKTAQFLLFAYMSPLSMVRKGHPTHFLYTPTKHSVKPECSYDLIESVSRPPRVELFARSARLGWVCLGKEITGNDILSDIAWAGGR